MSAHSCSLALGDGNGLNFVAKARGLVKYLLGHSLDQPQADATSWTTGTDTQPPLIASGQLATDD
jgi:hypothetical protein